MFFLIGGWRAKKHVKHGNRQILRTQSLYEAYGANLSLEDQEVIEGRLQYAAEVKLGMGDRPRWTQIKKARAYRHCADDALRYIERKLSSRPQIQFVPPRRRPN